MRLILFLAFCFAEALLIGELAERYGAAWVFLALLAAAAGGLALIRRSGWATLLEMQRTLGTGEVPVRTLLDSAVGVVAGLLLILPGFISDAIAFGLLLNRFRQRGKEPPEGPGSGPVTLDGDYREIDPERLSGKAERDDGAR